MVKKLVMALFLLFNPANPAPGDLPAVNTLFAQGNFGLPFNQPVTLFPIGYFVISNNFVNAFDLSLHFTNKGQFGGAIDTIPMTQIVINGLSGTLGTNLVPPANLSVTLDGSGDWTWNPGATQSTETVAYIIELKASWSNPSSKLAGFYTESITAVLTVGL